MRRSHSMNREGLPKIILYCDDASHVRRVTVYVFLRTRTLRSRLSRNAQAQMDAEFGDDAELGRGPSVNGWDVVGGTLLFDDLPVHPGVAGRGWNARMAHYAVQAPGEVAERERRRYKIACRRCPKRSIVVREENLQTALETLYVHGVSEISMLGLAATLQKQATSTA